MAIQDKQTLIKNVSIFDGTSKKLITGQDFVLAGNKIDKLTKSGGEEDAYDTVIDGGGRTLMPGLIDAHTHLAICASIPQMMSTYTWDYIGPLMGAEAERYHALTAQQ